MRLIPGRTKVKIEIFKGVTLADVGIGLVAALLIVDRHASVPKPGLDVVGIEVPATECPVQLIQRDVFAAAVELAEAKL